MEISIFLKTDNEEKVKTAFHRAVTSTAIRSSGPVVGGESDAGLARVGTCQRSSLPPAHLLLMESRTGRDGTERGGQL